MESVKKGVSLGLAVLALMFRGQAIAAEKVDYASVFVGRDACFVLKDLKSGKVVGEFNLKRCAERFSPCSTFKIAAAVMAFESKILKDDHQIVKWDGVKRERAELNQDQTPYSWIKNSAIWVTQWITPQLGEPAIQDYLRKFSYGNQDFSGGLATSWQTSSLKISADEQTRFLRGLWLDTLPVSERSGELTKKIIFIKNLGSGTELYGKTGTGCLVGHDCDQSPGGLMIGWFVGVLKTSAGSFVFAANASDTVADPQNRPAGPRLRDTIVDLFKQMGMTK